jgi:tRNA pseudouridine55 synthase
MLESNPVQLNESSRSRLPVNFFDSGILLVDKPAGMTSMDVIRVIKRIARPKKIGHAGTLDPFATGVLPILLNSATRLSNQIMAGTKEYQGSFLLGMVFDTQDVTGQQIGETKAVPLDLDLERVQEMADRFVGEIFQTPPLYSAIKKRGKPLYFYARNNIEVEVEPRKVVVEEFRILKKDQDRRFYFSARVQKGTYIRTLIHDLGESLGMGAVLESLRRIRTSEFHLDEAVQLSTLKFVSDIKSHLKTTEKKI